ncbi:hypothetical protein JAAARDRAFT_39481 [Jaapia argillacea MUCL 33604]|uniref:Calcofluor white hypersensitive protein n=1 Tax=Jaapia argillacea MUCL 33604 TaxID=933084 RepID=A0A067PDW4_9AGAM|nr:hypothetical protein JAAARDRAFT_39481 [Jaapia argillacea MUCL 33604]
MVSASHFTLNASTVARVHTALSLGAFLTALFLGCALHYQKIVKNGVAGYPEEWFPSVSATVGDWYPERNIFQILIALTSGPRFVVVILQYYLNRSQSSSLPMVVFLSGILRTFLCGGWVFITSNDDHDIHDILMISYIVCNLPWMLGGISCTTLGNEKAQQRRQLIATTFFASMIPMIYFFVQHKVHRIPGAYTHYSFFEWGLIFQDILYDSVAELDFKTANLQISLGSFTHESDEIRPILVENKLHKSEIEEVPVKAEIPSPRHLSREKSYDEETNPWKDTPSPNGHPIASSWRPITTFLSDAYLSYICWSIFTSLAPTLFYFSVWELGIAGHELALLSSLSPGLLGIPSFHSWSRTLDGRTTLHLLSFLGLAAYAVEDPFARLLAVALANMALSIRLAVDWTGADGRGAGYQGILTGLGLILSSLSKHANHSSNPVWPLVNETSGGYNKTGIALALLALAELYTRPSETPIIKRRPKQLGDRRVNHEGRTSWFIPAVSLGGLLFSLHLFLADSSTLIAWSWTGYPIKGPVPHTHGSLTILAQVLGLLIPLYLSSHAPRLLSILQSPAWFLYGAASAYVTFTYRNWLGYAGGWNLSVFLMSLIPQVFENAASSGKVARTYFTAWLVAILFDLANVWAVAYAFVPGGVYLRERTDLILIMQMATLAFGFNWPRLPKSAISMTLPSSTVSFTRILLVLAAVFSLLVTMYRAPTSSPQPFKPGARIVTAGIWTVHFGIDNEGRDSRRRMGDLIKDMQLDVVGLLETDLHRIVFGNRDLTRVIAHDLGYHVDIGPGPNSHTWGAVLLSKFPIINTTHHLLPSPHGELAPAIEAVLDIYGTEVTVIVAHNGQEEDPLDRELQSKELARIMAASYPRPVIFLGYVVTKPGAKRPAPYEILVSDGRMHDIDSFDFDRWCEYILYRGLYRTAYARVSRSTITDTELQIGQFVLPKHGTQVTDNSNEARYLRSWKEDLPESHWFPMEYYGNENEGGVRGHYYHVFNTPLYYKIPEGAIL